MIDKNNIVNRLKCINNCIDYDWLNQSFDYFKVKCKWTFLISKIFEHLQQNFNICQFWNCLFVNDYIFYYIFFYIHLGYSFNFTVVYLCHIMGGIPPPGGGIVGKNQSTRSKTTVRSKRLDKLKKDDPILPRFLLHYYHWEGDTH